MGSFSVTAPHRLVLAADCYCTFSCLCHTGCIGYGGVKLMVRFKCSNLIPNRLFRSDDLKGTVSQEKFSN